MTDAPTLLFYAAALLLPISALVARRAPIAMVMKMAVIWIAIFGLGASIIHIIA